MSRSSPAAAPRTWSLPARSLPEAWSTWRARRSASASPKGAPRPDISSADAFKRAMLAAKSVALSKPVGGGASGAHMAKVFEQLGITQAMASQIPLRRGGCGRFGGARRAARRGRDRHSADVGTDGGLRHRRRRPAACGPAKRDDVHGRSSNQRKSRRSRPRLDAIPDDARSEKRNRGQGLGAGVGA